MLERYISRKKEDIDTAIQEKKKAISEASRRRAALAEGRSQARKANEYMSSDGLPIMRRARLLIALEDKRLPRIKKEVNVGEYNGNVTATMSWGYKRDGQFDYGNKLELKANPDGSISVSGGDSFFATCNVADEKGLQELNTNVADAIHDGSTQWEKANYFGW